MAYTLCTEAQAKLAIGENASTTQLLTANTTIWVNFAESEMSAYANVDLVANVASIKTNYVQWFALIASSRAAFHALQTNPNSWSLGTTQTRLNVLDSVWEEGKRILQDKDKMALMGLTIEE